MHTLKNGEDVEGLGRVAGDWDERDEAGQLQEATTPFPASKGKEWIEWITVHVS